MRNVRGMAQPYRPRETNHKQKAGHNFVSGLFVASPANPDPHRSAGLRPASVGDHNKADGIDGAVFRFLRFKPE